ncbi:sulfotransferase family protein [Rhodovulum sulfidophilum]|uniref:Sulfotransferase n=1 Tax=Rhodovulum sulfidophilum TaxID=35806 RepID=A0ABS1RW36_RHOSU|nr:sulfotransferase [Rhodovulum sulfidophilum]MBL3610320.1 sulfotransferase [Rhodovulum sulfidophilum]
MVAQIDRAYLGARPGRAWPRLLAYGLFEGRPLTTRGRWINPAVFATARLLCRLPALGPVEAPAFILGTGRSGTTALGVTLSLHREVGFLNEPKALWASLSETEDLIGSYHRGPARYRLGAADADPALCRGARRIYAGYLRAAGARRIVDKYPEMIFRTGFLRAVFPDARFLFLSRGGAATAVSMTSWSRRHGRSVSGEHHDWWGADGRKWRLLTEQIVPEHPDLAAHAEAMAGLDLAGRAAVEWIVTMREGLALCAADPRGTLHLPYESLCAAPALWAAELERFLGLAPDPGFPALAATRLRPPAPSPAPPPLPDWLRGPFQATEAALARHRPPCPTSSGKPS